MSHAMTRGLTRELTGTEIDQVAGGVGWLVAVAVMAGSAAAGAGLAILTTGVKGVAPSIDGPAGTEEPGTSVRGTSKDTVYGPRPQRT